VVKKAEHYAPGDKTIFFEIDSALPLDGVFGFLANRSPKKVINGKTCHVIRTAKLRGTISQGLLVLPVDLGINPDSVEVGDDLTDWAEGILGVTKYERPLPSSVSGGTPKGNFPTHLVRKTDSERVQNLKSVWDEVVLDRSSWVPTEKIDGTSSTFINTEDGLIVCSRNWMINEGDNLYWDIAKRYGLEDLPVGSIVQGEIYGAGIQGNRLGVNGTHLGVFFASPELDDEDLPWVPTYDVELPDTVEGAVAQVYGLKSLVSPERLAEGIVWHNRYGEQRYLNFRSTFKAINNKYLLKEKE